jgi:hypothetical protein
LDSLQEQIKDFTRDLTGLARSFDFIIDLIKSQPSHETYLELIDVKIKSVKAIYLA